MAAPAKLLTTSIGFQNPEGTVVANGTLMLTLSQTATITATGGQVTTEPIYLPLDINGKITNTAVWFQDELSPSGTVYRGVVYKSNGMGIVPGLDSLSYSFTGAGPFDLATAVQSATASPSYSGAVLLTPAGSQTITTGSLTLTTGSFVETAAAVTGTGGLVRKTSPTLITPVLGVASGTSLALAGALTGAALTGASSGNSVTLLNKQDGASAITGTGADATLYTFTIPANQIQAGKGIRITVAFLHSTGTASVTYKLKLGASTLDTAVYATTSNTIPDIYTFTIFNNSGVQNAQTWTRNGSLNLNGANAVATAVGTSAENTANSLALTFTFSVAATDQITPKFWLVEPVQ